MLQVKGIDFSLKTLLNSEVYYKNFFNGGHYITIYLAPQDYHRIHSPYQGNITGYSYIPGTLFPVNNIAVRTIKSLFSKNERLITYIKTKHGMIAVVKVGATNVGRIKVVYDDDIITNTHNNKQRSRFYQDTKYINKGAELGRFEMGSTIIMLLEKETSKFLNIQEKQKVFYGQAIAEFLL